MYQLTFDSETPGLLYDERMVQGPRVGRDQAYVIRLGLRYRSIMMNERS